jgi:hypothetical protein
MYFALKNLLAVHHITVENRKKNVKRGMRLNQSNKPQVLKIKKQIEFEVFTLSFLFFKQGDNPEVNLNI